jgi:hypothetical protein
MSIPDVEAEITYPNCQSLFRHGYVPPYSIVTLDRLDQIRRT